MRTDARAIDGALLLAAVAFTLVVAAIATVLIKMNGPITAVHVEGELTASEQHEVRRVVSRLLDDGVLTVRLDALVDDIMALPWPRDVQVRKVWPNALEVRVDKAVVAARWGSTGAVTTAGQVITADGLAAGRLPVLSAAHGDGARAMQVYLTLRTVLAASGLDIAALEEDELGNWRVTFGNGLPLVLGDAQLTQRLERFLSVYGRLLHDKLDAIDSVDARYNNGIAVRWHDGRLPVGTQAGTGHVIAVGH